MKKPLFSFIKQLLGGGILLACLYSVSHAEPGGTVRAGDGKSYVGPGQETGAHSVSGKSPMDTAGDSREEPAGDPEIRSITSGMTADGDERISIAINGFFPPKVFALEGDRPRVVCDFEGARLAAAVKKSMVPEGPLVKMIRTGLHRKGKGKVRVVLDLKTGHRYEIEQVFFKKENLFELTVKSLGKESK